MRILTLTLALWACFAFAAPPRPTLADLDAVVARAGSIDAFLADKALVDEYYELLARFHGGKDRMTRGGFDNVLKQLREVAPKVPGLTARLWETSDLGTTFSIDVKMGRDSYNRRLDATKWQGYYRRMVASLASDAKPLLQIETEMIRHQRLKEILERIKKERDAIDADADKLGKRAATVLRAERMAKLNADPELKAAEAYLAHRFATSETATDRNSAGNADLLLYFYRDARNHPSHLFRTLGADIRPLAEATLGRARNLLPSVDDLLGAKEKMFEVQHSDVKPHAPIEYAFKPIPRKFHGIFWGIPMGACVGGKAANDVSPEFWGAIALQGSQLHIVDRNGEFHGVIAATPGKLGGETVATVALAAPDLAKKMIWTDPRTGDEQSVSLSSLWLREATRTKPAAWSGFVLAEGNDLDNWKTHSHGRTLGQYHLGEASHDGFVHLDPMAKAIAEGYVRKGLAKNYGGNMILDATVPDAGKLVKLDASIDEDTLTDSEKIREILRHAGDARRKKLLDHYLENPKLAERFKETFRVIVDDPDATIRARARLLTATAGHDDESLLIVADDPQTKAQAKKTVLGLLIRGARYNELSADFLARHKDDRSLAARLMVATGSGTLADMIALHDDPHADAGFREAVRAEIEELPESGRFSHAVAEKHLFAGDVHLRLQLLRMEQEAGRNSDVHSDAAATLWRDVTVPKELRESAKRFIGRSAKGLERHLAEADPLTLYPIASAYYAADGKNIRAAEALFAVELHADTDHPLTLDPEKLYAAALKSNPKGSEKSAGIVRRILAAHNEDSKARQAMAVSLRRVRFTVGGALEELIRLSDAGADENMLHPLLEELVPSWEREGTATYLKGDKFEALLKFYARALRSTDPQVNETAGNVVRMLAKKVPELSKHADFYAAIQHAVNGSSAETRRAAVAALLTRGDRSPATVAAFVELAKKQDYDSSPEAMKALTRIGHAVEAETMARENLAHAHPALRQAAFEVLAGAAPTPELAELLANAIFTERGLGTRPEMTRLLVGFAERAPADARTQTALARAFARILEGQDGTHHAHAGLWKLKVRIPGLGERVRGGRMAGYDGRTARESNLLAAHLEALPSAASCQSEFPRL